MIYLALSLGAKQNAPDTISLFSYTSVPEFQMHWALPLPFIYSAEFYYLYVLVR